MPKQTKMPKIYELGTEVKIVSKKTGNELKSKAIKFEVIAFKDGDYHIAIPKSTNHQDIVEQIIKNQEFIVDDAIDTMKRKNMKTGFKYTIDTNRFENIEGYEFQVLAVAVALRDKDAVIVSYLPIYAENETTEEDPIN